ncbi:hypothetical protein Goklo_025231 [Gossypium klotzschianum]|uniref:Uncharacterized protein n=1 Tax=Gossypium klotzschianum TaxID=34286 RepID=A0A7J8W317_9ROSI|nr:hypothetical protein [Gossypium klotzschianum]
MSDVVTKLCSIRDKLHPTRLRHEVYFHSLRCRMDEVERLGSVKVLDFIFCSHSIGY